MSQTLEQVNALRRMKGEEPLTELPSEEGNSGTGNEGGLGESGQQNTAVEDKNKINEPAPITDDVILKYLQQKGITVNSLDDLNKPKTEADIEKQAEDRENAKLTYGLNKGLFNRKTHEQFILDKSNKQQLVFVQYYQEAKKEDPELSDEDIQSEFASKYGLDSEPTTRKHKRGLQEIEILGDIILKNKYNNIYKLDGEYDTYEKQTLTQKEFERKLLSEAPNYKKTVDDVFGELKKITTKFSDDESYDVDILDDAIVGLKEKFLDKNFIAQKISEGYTKEELKEVAFTAILKQNWPLIAKEIANQAILKQQKGVKGIMPIGGQHNSSGNDQLNDKQKAVLQRLFPNHQTQVAN